MRSRLRAGGSRAVVAVAMIGGAMSAIVGSPRAQAHHAWTEIDTARTVTLEGTVKSLKWENPHASLVLATQVGGTRTEWTVLMSGLARMEGHGLESETVAVGRTLTIVASPVRDGDHVVRANRIRSDGKDHVLY